MRIIHYFWYLTDRKYRFIVNNKFYYNLYVGPVQKKISFNFCGIVIPDLRRTLYYSTDSKVTISFHFISISDDIRGWIKDLFEYRWLDSSKKIMIDSYELSSDKSKFIIQNFSENFIILKQVEKRLRKLNKI